MKKTIIIFSSILLPFVVGFLFELFVHQGVQHPDMQGSWALIVPIYLLIIGGTSALYTFLYQHFISNKNTQFAVLFTSIVAIVAVSRQIIFGNSLDFIALVIPFVALTILYFITKK